MIKKYPQPYDIQEVLNIQTVTRESIDFFCQSRGVFFINAPRINVAKELSFFSYEHSDLDEIRNNAYQSSNRQALSGFIINSKNEFDIENLYENLRLHGQLKGKGYSLSALEKRNDTGQTIFKGEIEYKKHKSGRVELLQDESRETEFYIYQLEDKSWQIEVDGSSSADGKEVLKLMKTMIKETSAEIETLEIKNLKRENIITFFDRLATEGFENDWTLVDVKELTFKRVKNKLDIEEDEDELDYNGSDLENVDEETLDGISQAILEGRNLREHSFVRQAEESGCVFTAMSYEFENTKEAKVLNIRAEFKGSPKIFEVSVINVGNIEGDKGNRRRYYNPEPDYKLRVSSIFWNNAKNIYMSF